MGPQLQTFFTQGLGLTKQPLSHEGEETGALEVHPPPSQWLSLERTSLPPTIQWPELWPHSRVHTYHMPGRQLLKYMHSSSGDGHSLQAQHNPPLGYSATLCGPWPWWPPFCFSSIQAHSTSIHSCLLSCPQIFTGMVPFSHSG